ncbi:LytTR family DNA-binding domain-containing protein [Pseudolactococcus plantarum]|nr:LytTR family DNA-binding domain-containing protein [Lactococcus plantarum]HCN74546.1 LytTR family transcriptional regulator [Lactococcus sp.]
MKIKLEMIPKTRTEQIIFQLHELTAEHQELIDRLKTDKLLEMILHKGDKKYRVLPKHILYFESVDKKTFAYTTDDVFEVREKLYQLEEKLSTHQFIRISKSMILNVKQIHVIYPTLSGRFEAELENQERVKISRNYVPALKRILGMKG